MMTQVSAWLAPLSSISSKPTTSVCGRQPGESDEEAWVCTGSRKVQTGDRIVSDGAAGNHHLLAGVFFTDVRHCPDGPRKDEAGC